MADNTSTRNQVKEITDRLEQGMKDLFTSERYIAYLQTMSRFHRYSTRNTLLIHMQKPDSTLVAGFQAWQSKFGRYVKKGERSIKILAPMPFLVREERQKLDPDSKRPILGEDGLPVMEEVERRLARFKVTSVFDVSQTDGKPLSELVEDLTGDVKHYALFMDALRAVSPLPIGFEPLDPEKDGDGLCRFGNNIAIREGMSEIQTISAVIHEIAHAKLHDIEVLRQLDEDAKPKDRNTQEVEAESISYAVCQYYGIETAANSFGYIENWSKARELKELSASLDTIRKAATELIDGIDEQFRTLAKERGVNLASEAVTTEAATLESALVQEISPEPAIPEKEQETSAEPDATPDLKPNQHIEVIDGVEFVVTAPFSTPTPTPPAIERQYDLGYGHLGNGLTVWNRLEEKDGDYLTVAHIAPDRSVTFYDKDIPDSVKVQIEDMARTSDMTVSASQDTPVINSPPKERTNMLEQRNYLKFAELFPQIACGEYSYQRLEAGTGLEPLSLEWIADGQISVMHTYTMNGDLMYDPMITYSIDNDTKTLTALEFEQSMPPMYQRVDEDGNGLNIDGNGRETFVKGLRTDINDFTSQWLDNIAQQGYMPVRANMEIDGEETQITFDAEGIPIMPEPTVEEAVALAQECEGTAPEPPAPPFDCGIDMSSGHYESDIAPDPAIGLSERDLFGYTGTDMLPLAQTRALKLFDQDHTIYMLYPDNTEAMVFEREEITVHDGIFGIDAGEWHSSPEYRRMTADQGEGTREAKLLYSEKNAFGIYQLKGGDELHYYRFTSLEQLEKDGLAVDRDNYELVYTGPLDIRDTLTNLGKIYETFNTDHPADFTGHSISVSDVVVLQWRGEVTSHYVDSVGFKELPAFLGGETQPQTERDTSSQVGNMSEPPGSTVAGLKAEVDAGRQISLSDLARAVNNERNSTVHKGRPSILAQLQEYQNGAAQGADFPKTAPKHDVQREV